MGYRSGPLSAGTITMSPPLRQIIGHFPQMEFAMAYGSGVFSQKGYAAAQRPMIDFIFGVRGSEAWHAENLTVNRNHYSALGTLGGAKCVTAFQRFGGQQIYYHPFVEVDGHPVKYGVMELSDLERDLEQWSTLFVSGRLHKPSALIETPERTAKLQQQNLNYALHTALALLPARFGRNQLWETIAGLSYCGDPRFAIGAENPMKVSNIVGADPSRFEDWYRESLRSIDWVQADGDFMQHAGDEESRKLIWGGLPSVLQQAAPEDLAAQHDDPGPFQVKLRGAIGGIVARPAALQAARGVVSAGVVKSIKYAWEKRSKSKAKKSLGVS